jgi:hypothetical protein
MWISPTSTEKYEEVPDGVVPCSPGARYEPFVIRCDSAVVAVEPLLVNGLA